MSDRIFLGQDSSSATPIRVLTGFGNALFTAGNNNLNGVTVTSVGAVVDYHRHLTINGLEGAFAGISNHGHNEIRVWNAAEDGQLSSTLYTADTTQSSQMAFVAGRAAIGATVASATEIAIDTRNTVVSGPASQGVVRLEYSGTSTGITLGQNVILIISTAMVAGIEAANYSGVVTAVSTLGGNTTIDVNISGLDGAHWNDAAKGRVTTLNDRWALAPLSPALTGLQSITAVSGPELDVTFSSVPASVVVGRVLSLWLSSGSTVTGGDRDAFNPASVISITGNVVRIRVRNVRFTTFYTFAGSDSNTARWSLHLGVADPAHDPTVGSLSWCVWRNATTGVAVGAAFGPCDVPNGSTNSVAVGLGIVARSANVFRFGTHDTDNVAQLVGNVLQVNGARVGANGVSTSRIRHGRATLVAGTVTVTDANVTANSRIFLAHAVDGGTVGWLRVSARIAGTSFTITSSSGADTSQVDWLMIEP